MKKIYVLLFVFPHILHSQGTFIYMDTTLDCNCSIYHTYVSGNISQWPLIIERMQQRYHATKTNHCLFNLVFAQYGYIAYLINTGDKILAMKYIREGEANADLLVQRKAYPSRVEALKGAFNAFKIALEPSKAAWYGPRSLNHINTSLRIDPNCPYGWVEKANTEYHIPRIFGGSYQKAAEYYAKSISIFESTQGLTYCNWYYLNAYLGLANSYSRMGNKAEARKTLQKLLIIAPGFTYVMELMQKL